MFFQLFRPSDLKIVMDLTIMLWEPVVVFLHDNIGQQTVNIWAVMKVMVQHMQHIL